MSDMFPCLQQRRRHKRSDEYSLHCYYDVARLVKESRLKHRCKLLSCIEFCKAIYEGNALTCLPRFENPIGGHKQMPVSASHVCGVISKRFLGLLCDRFRKTC